MKHEKEFNLIFYGTMFLMSFAVVFSIVSGLLYHNVDPKKEGIIITAKVLAKEYNYQFDGYSVVTDKGTLYCDYGDFKTTYYSLIEGNTYNLLIVNKNGNKRIIKINKAYDTETKKEE